MPHPKDISRGRTLPLEISLDRRDRRSLVDQMADGLRNAIAVGRCRPGDVLPTIRDFARLLDVSIRVPSGAFKKLAAEGLLDARPKTGTVVLGQGGRGWLGHVLVYGLRYDYVYHYNVVSGFIRRRLMQAGYLVTPASSPRDGQGREDYSHLRKLLKQQVDFALLLCENPATESVMAESGVPYAVVGSAQRRHGNMVGFVKMEQGAAVRDFLRHCESRRVRRLLCVCKHESEAKDLRSLSMTGTAVETLAVRCDMTPNRVEELARAAMARLREWLRANRAALPDLIFFADDNLAQGALLALLEAGVKVPDDVEVATVAVTGHGPVFTCELTRIAWDAIADGERIAGAVLQYMSGRGFPAGLSICPRYVIGESFPANAAPLASGR